MAKFFFFLLLASEQGDVRASEPQLSHERNDSIIGCVCSVFRQQKGATLLLSEDIASCPCSMMLAQYSVFKCSRSYFGSISSLVHSVTATKIHYWLSPHSSISDLCVLNKSEAEALYLLTQNLEVLSR